MAQSKGFPSARGRAPGGPLPLAEVFERYQSFDEATLGDTLTTFGTFAGRPDSIVLAARTNGAVAVLTDRLDRELDTIVVPAGQTVETHIRAERVRARNATAGANALFSAHGKWASKAEAGSGYSE